MVRNLSGTTYQELSSRESRITLLLGERTCEVFVGGPHVRDRDLSGVGIEMSD